jgi:DNA-binding GntR family transcriptional regulator
MGCVNHGGLELADGDMTTGLYRELASRILSGTFSPGERLSEAGLARDFGVSRSPIRTAIAKLEHAGLLQRSGLVISVRERSAEDILEICRVRVSLEGMIAYDAALRWQELDIVRLKAAVLVGDAVNPVDAAAVVRSNREFHEALVAAAHNATLADLQERLSMQVAAAQSTTLTEPGRWQQAHAEHQGIVAAVQRRGADEAQRLAQMHLERARGLRMEMIRRAVLG